MPSATSTNMPYLTDYRHCLTSPSDLLCSFGGAFPVTKPLPFIIPQSFPLLYPHIPPVRANPLSRIGHSLRRDFLCKGTACVRSSSTASLTVSGYNGSLPQIKDGLSAPTSLQGIAGRAVFCSYTRRLGIPFHPVHCLLVLSVLLPLSVLHKNHSPTRSRKSFKKREKKQINKPKDNEQVRFYQARQPPLLARPR